MGQPWRVSGGVCREQENGEGVPQGLEMGRGKGLVLVRN